MTSFIQHPRLSTESVEARGYQIEAVSDCLGSPTLLVLPTALGKTPIEWMVIAERLNSIGGKALLIAPTNALVNQHFNDLKRVIDLQDSEGSIAYMNGSIDWNKRKSRWDSAEIIVATPQVIRNDVKRGSIDLKDVSVLIVDEAHHSKGRHAVAEVGDQYLQSAENPLILGATASPGSSKEQVEEVCRRLGLKRIHSRTAENPLLEPYAAELEIKEVNVEVDEGLKLMSEPLVVWMNNLVDQLRRLGYHVQSGRVTSSQLNDTRERIQKAISKREGLAYNAARQCAQAQRLLNLIGYLLSQGVAASREYLERVKISGEGGDKGASLFFNDERILSLYETLKNSPELHEKVEKTVELVQTQIENDPDSRVIVFAHFRDTVDEIVRRLDDSPIIKPERFVGQAKREGSSGLSQKEQLVVLQRFREGECNVLVATSVGEEGLDVPRADRVIFYEPIGSEIRTIQRRGRTGRHRDGNVYVLIAKGTRDEGARKSAAYREKRMQSAIDRVRRNMGRPNNDDLSKHITSFEVIDEDGVRSAFSFMQSEKERLAPELGERKNRISISNEQIEDEKPSTESDSEINPKRLRPKGQTGLDSFPSIAPETNPIDDNKEEEQLLQKISIQAADEIVQALTTEAIDPLEKESENSCQIVVNNTEFNASIGANLRKKGLDIDFEAMAIGDFKIGDRVLIERKFVPEFIGSLLEGRLLEQANTLISEAERPLLLIEGGGLFTQKSVHNNSLMGALATLTIDLGLPVITTKDNEETARFLIIAAKREQALLGALTKEARGRMSLR